VKLDELHGLLASRYRIESLIARGGIGSTYLGVDIKENRKVAIKALDFNRMEDWKILELFQREVKTLKAVRHPLIPDYYDNFEHDEDGRKYFILVQEYVAGANLHDLVASGKRFTPQEAATVLTSLLKTLRYLHGLHPPVIHRDINPKNIILTADNQPYLVDFGAVGLVKNTMAAAMSDTFVGTIGYIAPEQLYGKVSPASDLYSLGVTILFLLTGREPFQFELSNLKINFQNQAEIPYALGHVLDRLLEPDASHRYGRAAEVLADLKEAEGVLSDRSTGLSREAKKTAPPPPPRRLSAADRIRLHGRLFGDSGFFGMSFAGLGMIFVFIFVIFGRTFPALLLLGADNRAVGTVISVEGTHSSENDEPVYRNNFTFRAADDREYQQHSFTTGSHFAPGQSVDIVYLSVNPRLAVIKDARYSTFDAFVLFTVIFPAIGFGLMFAGRPRRPGRYLRLLRRGLVAGGKVIAKRAVRQKAWLDYEYKTEGGFARGRILHPRQYDFDIGDDCIVLYGPKTGGASILLGRDMGYTRGRWQTGTAENNSALVKTLLPVAGYYGLWLVLVLALGIVVFQII
jgi:hypothetical protein